MSSQSMLATARAKIQEQDERIDQLARSLAACGTALVLSEDRGNRLKAALLAAGLRPELVEAIERG